MISLDVHGSLVQSSKQSPDLIMSNPCSHMWILRKWYFDMGTNLSKSPSCINWKMHGVWIYSYLKVHHKTAVKERCLCAPLCLSNNLSFVKLGILFSPIRIIMVNVWWAMQHKLPRWCIWSQARWVMQQEFEFICVGVRYINYKTLWKPLAWIRPISLLRKSPAWRKIMFGNHTSEIKRNVVSSKSTNHVAKNVRKVVLKSQHPKSQQIKSDMYTYLSLIDALHAHLNINASRGIMSLSLEPLR